LKELSSTRVTEILQDACHSIDQALHNVYQETASKTEEELDSAQHLAGFRAGGTFLFWLQLSISFMDDQFFVFIFVIFQ
jgi:hypothetical protein